jgi:hypothetical protein
MSSQEARMRAILEEAHKEKEAKARKAQSNIYVNLHTTYTSRENLDPGTTIPKYDFGYVKYKEGIPTNYGQLSYTEPLYPNGNKYNPLSNFPGSGASGLGKRNARILRKKEGVDQPDPDGYYRYVVEPAAQENLGKKPVAGNSTGTGAVETLAGILKGVKLGGTRKKLKKNKKNKKTRGRK